MSDTIFITAKELEALRQFVDNGERWVANRMSDPQEWEQLKLVREWMKKLKASDAEQ